MARKNNTDELIHCNVCGEDYSSTYRRCPFCGERVNARPADDEEEFDEENSGDEEITNDVCWYYDEGEDYAEWQMYIKNFEPDFALTFMFPNFHETVPILAGLGVRKVELNA